MTLDANRLDKGKTPIDVFWHAISRQLRGSIS